MPLRQTDETLIVMDPTFVGIAGLLLILILMIQRVPVAIAMILRSFLHPRACFRSNFLFPALKYLAAP